MAKEPYTSEEIEQKFNNTIILIKEGKSLRTALKELRISSRTFFKWIDESEEMEKRYARACEYRTEMKFESIEADYSEIPQRDQTGRIDPAWVNLQRLKIDAKKWELSKLNPKKYGDKIDITSDGEKVQSAVNLSVIPDEILKKMLDEEDTNNEGAG